MSLLDPSTERVSACPVHFIWDGRGAGRTWVRLGFLGFLVGAMLLLASQWTHAGLLRSPALATEVLASLSYAVGQALSWSVSRATPRRAS